MKYIHLQDDIESLFFHHNYQCYSVTHLFIDSLLKYVLNVCCVQELWRIQVQITQASFPRGVHNLSENYKYEWNKLISVLQEAGVISTFRYFQRGRIYFWFGNHKMFYRSFVHLNLGLYHKFRYWKYSGNCIFLTSYILSFYIRTSGKRQT